MKSLSVAETLYQRNNNALDSELPESRQAASQAPRQIQTGASIQASWFAKTLDVDRRGSRALIAFSRDDLVIESANVHAMASPGVDMVGNSDRTADAFYALKRRQLVTFLLLFFKSSTTSPGGNGDGEQENQNTHCSVG